MSGKVCAWIGSIVILLVLALMGPGGQVVAVEEVATTLITPNEIFWSPNVAYESIALSVSDPNGFVTTDVFPGGTVPSLSADGLPSGLYTYELRVRPMLNSSTQAAIDAARNSDDREAVGEELTASGQVPESAITQSGGFTIDGGRFIGGESESRFVSGDQDTATRDQVILDDLIVDGSACIGFDCVDGESFGFDTLRLKENNLGIKFQDTSSTSSFASNDWQITANDSANGGLNKFSIDDIDGGRTPFTLEAGAPSHSLYVDDGGRVGFGTSTPVVDLHAKSGNTPTLRLDQDGSSGFTPQAWDVAGAVSGRSSTYPRWRLPL